MEDRHHRRREMFLRLKSFANNRPENPATVWPQLVTELDSVNANLAEQIADEQSGHSVKRTGTASRDDAREDLKDLVEAIARTARAIDETKPGFAEGYRGPSQLSDRALLDLAIGIARIAPPQKADFLSHGMPPDFLETLDARVARLQQTMTDQSEGKAGVKSAGVEIEDTMDNGMSVRRRMDAVVRNVYRDDAAVLAEWETASHIEQAPRRKAKAEEPKKDEPK
jgi:hypothetical protein